MRELRFRAYFEKKFLASGHWQEGELMNYSDNEPAGLGYWFGYVEFRYHKAEEEPKIMEWTGSQDRAGKDVYEGDLLRVKHKLADNDAHYVDAIYEACISPKYGLYLRCRKPVMSEDVNNQHPIHLELNFKYGTLGEDYMNQQYERLAVMENWNENHFDGSRWITNHYSNDIEIVGNVWQDSNLLKE